MEQNSKEIVNHFIPIAHSSQYQFAVKSQSSEQSSRTQKKDLIAPPNYNSKTNNISIYQLQYQQYFQDIEQQVHQRIIQCLQNTTRKFEHKIVLLKQTSDLGSMISFEKPSIYHTGSLHNGSLMLYEAIIGNYKLAIDLLNLPIEAPKKVKEIGSGTYGSIYLIPYYRKQIVVAKRIIFNYQQNIEDLFYKKWRIRPNPHELHEAISEYCIYKISSFYKIGPCTVHNLGFDLICFNNCVEFYMEPCIQLSCNYMNLQEDIKISTRLLHELHIIHKDIKPSNILFSPTYERFVLVDYGISHPIKENIGQLSLTYRQGSPSFMSKQMRQIKHGESQYINLYYNDLFGLKQSLQQFKKYSKLKKLKATNLPIKIQVNVNLQYLQIYLLDILLKRNKEKLSQFVSISNFRPYFIKSKVFDQFSSIFKIKQKLFQDLSLDPVMIQISQTKPSQLIQVQFLIRCNGLSQKLQYDLNKLSQTPLIINIKDQIMDLKWNPTINQKCIQFLQLNQNEFIMKKCIQRLQNTEQNTKEQNIKRKRQLFKYLFKLYGLIINKPAEFIDQIYQILKKIQINKITQKDNIFYKICVFMFHCKIQMKILICKKEFEKLLQDYPEHRIEILQLLSYVIHKKFKLQCQTLCLAEYLKQQIKYRIKILKKYNYIVQQYYERGQTAKCLWYFNQQKKKIQDYKKNYLNQEQYDKINQQQLKYYINIYEVSGNHQMALKYYHMCLQKQLEFYGERQNRIISWYYQIALCYIKLNRFKQAQTNLLKIIQILQFYVKDYLTTNFIQHCQLMLICIYVSTSKIEKIQRFIKNLFFGAEKNQKQMNHSQYLKIKIKEKAHALILEFPNDKRKIIAKFLIFKQCCYNYFKQLTYLQKIQSTMQKYNIKGDKILSPIINYIQLYKQQIANYLNLIIQQYMMTPVRYQLINQLISDFAYLCVNVIPINRRQLLLLVKQFYQQEVNQNNNLVLCICYLKIQYSILQKKYSQQFINCTSRISINLFRINYNKQCIYYSIQLLNILENAKCEQKQMIYQLYERIIRCQIVQGIWKKLERMKIKQLKHLKKRILSIIEYGKFYRRILKLNHLVIFSCYIRYILKKQNLKIKLSNHFKFRITNQQKICKMIFASNKGKSEPQSQVETFKLITLMKQYQFLRLKLGVFKQIKSIKKQIEKYTKILI